jgi:CheY-like chemotaxis protein
MSEGFDVRGQGRSALAKVTCFLVDDDAEDREIFALALAEISRAHECVTAEDGVDALEKLNSNKLFIPDIIFVDLNMPRMGGKELLTEIKKNRRVTHIPVVAFSTSSQPRDIEDTRKLGASHFLTKPPSISALVAALENLLSGKIKSFFYGNSWT